MIWSPGFVRNQEKIAQNENFNFFPSFLKNSKIIFFVILMNRFTKQLGTFLSLNRRSFEQLFLTFELNRLYSPKMIKK